MRYKDVNSTDRLLSHTPVGSMTCKIKMLGAKLRLEDIFSIDGVKYVDYSRDLYMDMPILIEKLWPGLDRILWHRVSGVTSVAPTPRS